MSEVKGHAAFHKHKKAPRHPGTKAGTRGERRALLKESMRHLDPKEVARQAKKNGSIVAADAHLNTAYVNDGTGGFEVATSVKQVLDYGDAREKRVHRKIAAGSRTVDLFVVHLPRTMCVEIKDYYPRHNPDGSERLDPETGEPMSRSRWVARDHDETMRYFVTAVAFLGLKVSPGGMDSIHGWATNFDESTPHIQVMADPFAPDPKMPGALRTEASRAYTSHAEVRKANGKMYGKGERIRAYQAQMRERMIAEGYPVEREPGEHHGRELPKEVFEEMQDEKAEAASLRAAGHEAIVEAAEAAAVAETNAQLDQQESEIEHALLVNEWADLEEAEDDLEERRQDVAERETDWLTRKRKLDAREADLDRRDREAADDRLAAQNARCEAEDAHRVASANQRASERARAQAEADRQYARDLVAKIEWMPPEVDDWLDRRKVGDGRTMRDLFNEDTKKRRSVLAEVQALINSDGPQQTGPRTGDHERGS